MFIGYFDGSCVVELNNGNKIHLSKLNIGDCVKGVNKSFCHNYKNKMECIADRKNYCFNKITNISTINNKTAFEITTDEQNKIICSLGTKFKTMQRIVGLNKYNTFAIAQILDDYETDVDDHNFVMSYGFDFLYGFKAKGQKQLVGIEVENNNPIFINDFLLG